MSERCLFCAIAAGDTAGHVVLATADFVGFLDVRPLFPGHTLLVPRQHVVTLPELPAALRDGFVEQQQRLATAMVEVLGAQGSFVAMNNTVSQSVPHLHCHVVPRTKGDGLRGFFWPRTTYADGEAAAYADRLRTALGLTVRATWSPHGDAACRARRRSSPEVRHTGGTRRTGAPMTTPRPPRPDAGRVERTDPSRVRAHLDRALAPNVRFVDPSVDLVGVDAFEANIHRSTSSCPGATYSRVSEVDSHHDHHRYHWAIHSGGDLILAGFDVTVTDDDGRVEQVIGFFGPLEPPTARLTAEPEGVPPRPCERPYTPPRDRLLGSDLLSGDLGHQPLPVDEVVAGSPSAAVRPLAELGEVEVGLWEMSEGECPRHRDRRSVRRARRRRSGAVRGRLDAGAGPRRGRPAAGRRAHRVDRDRAAAQGLRRPLKRASRKAGTEPTPPSVWARLPPFVSLDGAAGAGMRPGTFRANPTADLTGVGKDIPCLRAFACLGSACPAGVAVAP